MADIETAQPKIMVQFLAQENRQYKAGECKPMKEAFEILANDREGKLPIRRRALPFATSHKIPQDPTMPQVQTNFLIPSDLVLKDSEYRLTKPRSTVPKAPPPSPAGSRASSPFQPDRKPRSSN
ncbi:hypothetical protein TWF569_001561 [Orbilia oligospora]|uniref:Uncharacterized protein n=1 Tax=Orbilia oligospora TaxID=2813651 RepID=A0A7C8J8F6_ORBOL|nr:hypothetical protein TWF102_008015 [Orbilia oligospora]KAF3118691.1 hypothetical protein TWF703_004485 [Orbilia oligospora]KAF3123931.1 hypothetical protein TWF569_001561 [Orbilia oligospora]KAF3125546.1 hypothetical protein TWF594_001538 [Orbilia oligospora]